MEAQLNRPCTAFADYKKIASGSLDEVIVKTKKFLSKNSKKNVLIFDDLTSTQIEIDLRGTTEAVLSRLPKDPDPAITTGPGRPKLGVVSKEISLLPRHWEWLALQNGGASATLRKLVEEAKKNNQAQDKIRQSQLATHKFMSALAGDLALFEEALRALYAKDQKSFEHLIAAWPKDLSDHIQKISHNAFK